MTPDTSVYLHIPFCKHRCAYCDFNTYAGQEDSIPAYVNALVREIDFVGSRRFSDSANQRGDYSTTELSDYRTIHTVFFGGGTPSLLSAPQFDSVLRALRAAFTFTADAEISIEANPGTISPKIIDIHKVGINLISWVCNPQYRRINMLERA